MRFRNNGGERHQHQECTTHSRLVKKIKKEGPEAGERKIGTSTAQRKCLFSSSQKDSDYLREERRRNIKGYYRAGGKRKKICPAVRKERARTSGGVPDAKMRRGSFQKRPLLG